MKLESKAEPTVKQAVPFFGVSNIEDSVRYYVEGLGFEMTKQWVDDGKLRWCWLNQATQHWYSTGSGSDRAPFGECVSVGARSLPLPVLYHRMYQCCLVRFRARRRGADAAGILEGRASCQRAGRKIRRGGLDLFHLRRCPGDLSRGQI